MAGNRQIYERLMARLHRASDALDAGEAEPAEQLLPAADPPQGLAERTAARLRAEGLLPPEQLAARTIDRLHGAGLLPASSRRARRLWSVWKRPVTSTVVRLATAACLLLALRVFAIPETADRVEPVQKRLLGERVTNTLSRWGHAILDRWS